MTNIVAEHAKSSMTNGKAVPEYVLLLIILTCIVMAETFLILYTSRYDIYKPVLIAT